MQYGGDEARAQYLKRMEWIIGKHCTNATAPKGFRYPVHYRKNGKAFNSKIMPNVELKDIPSMYYQFGSNRLEIGKALIEILDFLEKELDNQDIWRPFDQYGVDDEDED